MLKKSKEVTGAQAPTDKELDIGDWDYSWSKGSEYDYDDDYDDGFEDTDIVKDTDTHKSMGKQGKCTADPHSKVAKKIYLYKPLLMAHDSMTISKPALMEKPKPGGCVCDDCQKTFADQLQAYDDYLDDVKDFEEVLETIKLEKDVAEKKQTLAEKQKIAEAYLQKEAMQKGTKKTGNPILAVDPWLEKQKTIIKSIPGSSHDKTGKYGGVSSYTDDDVSQAYVYMQTVLGITEMSINGRALSHILAEVYGFSSRDAAKEMREIKAQLGKQKELEAKIEKYQKAIKGQEAVIEQLTATLNENEKYVEVAKKLDKEKVAATSTGRRIKE